MPEVNTVIFVLSPVQISVNIFVLSRKSVLHLQTLQHIVDDSCDYCKIDLVTSSNTVNIIYPSLISVMYLYAP